jgi:hypothetical protein
MGPRCHFAPTRSWAGDRLLRPERCPVRVEEAHDHDCELQVSMHYPPATTRSMRPGQGGTSVSFNQGPVSEGTSATRPEQEMTDTFRRWLYYGTGLSSDTLLTKTWQLQTQQANASAPRGALPIQRLNARLNGFNRWSLIPSGGCDARIGSTFGFVVFVCRS